MKEEHTVSYRDLRVIADRILEDGEDDPEALALSLGHLPQEIREELLVSDLLNAWQVFYYFFREDPGDLELNRLILEPASALTTGVFVTGIDDYEISFRVDTGEPVVSVLLGSDTVAEFLGKTAYRQALQFVNDAVWGT